ncbi:Signal transducer regulating beta-lactamase production, contains metallopeptidase domain [Paenibacillus sp. OK003]|nr:Signal transducer regulating beta-lactamase production, contains metallopeptidase domain [Paenibacillus sp. OK003]
MELLLSLSIASFVGSMIWIVQSSMRPITQKVFSQAWHYYTALIPVFFLLGGTEIMIRMIQFIHSFLTSKSVMIPSQSIIEQIEHISLIEHTVAGNPPFMQTLVDSLLQFANIHDLFVITLATWIAGIIVFLAVNANNYWVFKRSILQNSRAANMDIKSVKVFISPNAITPMVIGFLKPVIVMPDTCLGKQETAMILSHELIHINRRDLLVKFFVLLANAIHWFNPMVYFISKQTNIYCELSCDEKVVQEMDSESRRLYGETLLSMLEYGVMRRNLMGISSLYHSKEDMKRRLGNLMSAKKTKKSIVMLSLVASIVLVGSGGIAANYASAAAGTSSKYLREGGSNVTVVSSDGTTISYDKEGNIIPVALRHEPRVFTKEEIVERIKLHIKKGIPVPEGYITQLKKQGEKDELAALFDGINQIDLFTEDGVSTFNVADLIKS